MDYQPSDTELWHLQDAREKTEIIPYHSGLEIHYPVEPLTLKETWNVGNEKLVDGTEPEAESYAQWLNWNRLRMKEISGQLHSPEFQVQRYLEDYRPFTHGERSIEYSPPPFLAFVFDQVRTSELMERLLWAESVEEASVALEELRARDASFRMPSFAARTEVAEFLRQELFRDELAYLLQFGSDPAKVRQGLQDWESRGKPDTVPNLGLNGKGSASRPVAVVALLLEAGAQPGWQEETGPIVSRFAREGNVAVVRLLLEKGAKPGELRGCLRAAMDYSPSKKNLEAVKLLLEAGANPHEEGLWWAVVGTPKLIELLLAFGADINSLDSEFGSPLHVAVRQNEHKGAKTLLAAGANPNQVWEDENGKRFSPLEQARELKRKKLIGLLEGAPKKPAAKLPTIKSSWKSIGQVPGVAGQGLRGPASSTELESLAQVTGAKLPADFKALYKVHNGQAADKSVIPPWRDGDSCYHLLSSEQVAQEWKNLNEWQQAGDFEDCQASADDGVQQTWYHHGWLPFATNGAGDYLCCDTAPAKGGKKGQVISYDHESGKRELLASSMKEWLSQVAEELARFSGLG